VQKLLLFISPQRGNTADKNTTTRPLHEAFRLFWDAGDGAKPMPQAEQADGNLHRGWFLPLRETISGEESHNNISSRLVCAAQPSWSGQQPRTGAARGGQVSTMTTAEIYTKTRHHNKSCLRQATRLAALMVATFQTASPLSSFFSFSVACSRPRNVSSSYGFCSLRAARCYTAAAAAEVETGTVKWRRSVVVEEDEAQPVRTSGNISSLPTALRMLSGCCTDKCSSQEGSRTTHCCYSYYTVVVMILVILARALQNHNLK